MISEFINYMRENLSPQDDKAIVDWLQVTAELSDANETLIRQIQEMSMRLCSVLQVSAKRLIGYIPA